MISLILVSSEIMVEINVKIEDELIDDLSEVCWENNLNLEELVLNYIQQGLDNYKGVGSMSLISLDRDVMEKVNVTNKRLYLTFNYQSISSHKFLEVKDLEIGYYFSLLPEMNFQIKSGEKLAITGFNGIGKTTLLKTLIGELHPIKGWYKFVDDAKIAYFSQEHEWADDSLTPYQMVSNEYPEKDAKWIRSELAKVALTGTQTMQPIKTLSGGEQSKLKLCKIMLKKANVLILDEPTNHLDKIAKEDLLKYLKQYPGTVIFVSHEKEFINSLATQIYNIEDLLTS